MYTLFMPDLPQEERVAILKDTCASSTVEKYYRDLSDQEIVGKRELLSVTLIQETDLKEELDNIKADFKAKIEPKRMLLNELTQHIKTRKELTLGTLYHLPNFEADIMETYDERGVFISSRNLKPEERQQRLFPVKRIADK